MKNNCLILKTEIELAHIWKERLYCMFVDLQKVYEKNPRHNLFHVLLYKLNILESNIKLLICIDFNIKASVLLESKYA